MSSRVSGRQRASALRPTDRRKAGHLLHQKILHDTADVRQQQRAAGHSSWGTAFSRHDRIKTSFSLHALRPFADVVCVPCPDRARIALGRAVMHCARLEQIIFRGTANRDAGFLHGFGILTSARVAGCHLQHSRLLDEQRFNTMVGQRSPYKKFCQRRARSRNILHMSVVEMQESSVHHVRDGT